MDMNKVNGLAAANISHTVTTSNPELLQVAEILTSLGVLLIAESPIKSPAQKEADAYRGKLLAVLGPERSKPFLATRNILANLGRLITRCKNLEQLSVTGSYLEAISRGEVLLVADDVNEEASRERLRLFVLETFGIEATEDQLTQITYLVLNLRNQ